MPEFYGIEYDKLQYGIEHWNTTHYFDLYIDTDKDFHDLIYTAMSIFQKYKDAYCIFNSQNDYTHFGFIKNNTEYKFNMINLLPLIDKSAMRAMIDAEMQRLAEYANIAQLQETKSARKC